MKENFYHGILGIKEQWGVTSNQETGEDYVDILLDDGVENILKYGIACYKKKCKVMIAKK